MRKQLAGEYQFLIYFSFTCLKCKRSRREQQLLSHLINYIYNSVLPVQTNCYIFSVDNSHKGPTKVSHVSTVNTLGQIILCCGGALCIAGQHPSHPPTRCQQHPLSPDNEKNLWATLPNVPWGAKPPPCGELLE